MAEGLSKYSPEEWNKIMEGIDSRQNASNAAQYGQKYGDSSKDFFGF